MLRQFIKFAELFVWMATLSELLWKWRIYMRRLLRSCLTCLLFLIIVITVATAFVVWNPLATGAMSWF